AKKASENRSRSTGAKQACEQWTLTLASTLPFDLRRKNSLLSAKNSLFRCVGNSASKPLSFLTDWTSRSAAEASFSQNSLFFSLLAGKDGSDKGGCIHQLKAAPTARHRCRRPP